VEEKEYHKENGGMPYEKENMDIKCSGYHMIYGNDGSKCSKYKKS
jgi:hypothetical protein